MAEQLEVTLEELDRATEADIRAVLAKASGGKPLSAAERQMIADERTRLAKKSDLPFKLQGEGPRGALSRLTQEELAGVWGYSPRQVKNWLKEGKDVKDLCPLRDAPGEMPAWFERVYAPRSCPERLRMKADELCRVKVAPVAAEPENKAAPMPLLAEEEMGLLAALQRLREAEAQIYAKYARAIDLGDENKAKFYFSEWGKVGERLRAMEKSAPKALEEAGIFVRKEQVLRELIPIHAAIVKSFKQALRKGRVKLLSCRSPEEWDQRTDALTEEVCGLLAETSFSEPLELI